MFRSMSFLLGPLSLGLRRNLRPALAIFRQRPKTASLFTFPIAFAAAGNIVHKPPCAPTSAEISKIMLPDDANPAGNVHGGTILQMIDQAGFIAATRFCNQGADLPLAASLARIEQCEFHSPMHIGEVAQVHAEVSFVATHSLEVLVEVSALNPVTGKIRRTNTARAWYVAKSVAPGAPAQPAVLPPMVYASGEAERAGHDRYEKQKQLRQSAHDLHTVVEACASVRQDMMRLHLAGENRIQNTVAMSASSLVQLMLPSDCAAGNVVQAGAIMKLMDSVAGIVAARHCRKNVVTVSLDSMDFHTPIRNANVVTLYAWPTFTSARSIEIEVAVFTEDIRCEQQQLCNSSRFTFVCLEPNGSVSSLPQLVTITDEERKRFEAGRLRYEGRKGARSK